MSVFKDQRSPFYRYDFQLQGRRFYGSTKCKNLRDAEKAERDLKAKAKEDLENEKKYGSNPFPIRYAFGRYWEEVGKHHVNASDTWRRLQTLVQFFGPNKRLDEITDADVAALVAWRRQQTVHRNRAKPSEKLVENSTVNRSTIAPLKAVFSRAKRTWKLVLVNEPNWRAHWLSTPEERVRELTAKEAEALVASVREDFADWLAFAHLSGRRRQETLILWSHVGDNQIVSPGKGSRRVVTPITPQIREIIERQRGHHPTHVFTFVARQTAGAFVRGQRYPITREGAKTQWRRLAKRSKVKDFRFHDLRHDRATKVLRATGNLKLVQRVLNHSNIATTARYAHVADEDVADALERSAITQKSDAKSPNNSPTTKTETN